MEKLLNFLENELASVITIILILVGLGIFLKIAWKMKKKMDVSVDPSMSNRQLQAANTAIKKLEKAQKLLMDGDDNLEEAIKLRDEAVSQDLPPNKVYIKGEDPRSLLLAVNKRIDGAHSRGYVKEARAAQRQAEGREE